MTLLFLKARLLIQRMVRVAMRHGYMKQNRVADALAKEGGKIFFFGRTTMLAVPPMFVNKLF